MSKVRKTEVHGNKIYKPFRINDSDLFYSKTIRYYDEFSGILRTIKTDDYNWHVLVDGREANISWDRYQKQFVNVLKCFVSWAFDKYDASTMLSFLNTLNTKSNEISHWLIEFSNTQTAKTQWEGYGYKQLADPLPYVLRSLSIFLCEFSLGGWSPDDLEYLNGWKWFSDKENQSTKTSGGYYLLKDEEQAILNYFDTVSSSDYESYVVLRRALVLYFSYAFGMRPIQIASLREEDIDIVCLEDADVVHVTFYRSKQRSSRKKEAILRKIRREWCSIMVDYINSPDRSREEKSSRVHLRSLFNLTPSLISDLICATSKTITGRKITPTYFRHVAAQRMADLGMSQLELAEFLGHSAIDTCLIYFENSASQAEIVNRALGLSPIYRQVESISKNRYLKDEELYQLPDDKQIGGSAHGIPLAGIGGCSLGQSLCKLSPAISCYTCPKFLPINDVRIHRSVANELSMTVEQFASAGRSDASNPAHTQLSKTMESILGIIDSIENSNA